MNPPIYNRKKLIINSPTKSEKRKASVDLTMVKSKDVESGKAPINTAAARAAVGPQLAMVFHIVAMGVSCAILEMTAVCDAAAVDQGCLHDIGMASVAMLSFAFVFLLNTVALWLFVKGVEYTRARVITYYMLNFFPVAIIFVSGCKQVFWYPLAAVSIVVSIADIGLLGYRIWAAKVYGVHYKYTPPSGDDTSGKGCCGCWAFLKRASESFKMCMFVHLMLLGLLTTISTALFVITGASVAAGALSEDQETDGGAATNAVMEIALLFRMFSLNAPITGAIVATDIGALMLTLCWTPPKWTVTAFYIFNLIPAGITTWLIIIGLKGLASNTGADVVGAISMTIPVIFAVFIDVFMIARRIRKVLRTEVKTAEIGM